MFCKIRCPLHRLQKHADLTDFKLLLDREALKTICSTGREGLWDPIKLQEFAEHNELTTLSAFEYIYAKYEFDTELDLTNDHLFPLYKKWPRLTIEHLMEERNEVATSMFGNVKSTNDDISTNNLLRVPSARNAATSPSTRNPMGGGALSPNKGKLFTFECCVLFVFGIVGAESSLRMSVSFCMRMVMQASSSKLTSHIIIVTVFFSLL